jgi:hypothetical protein
MPQTTICRDTGTTGELDVGNQGSEGERGGRGRSRETPREKKHANLP